MLLGPIVESMLTEARIGCASRPHRTRIGCASRPHRPAGRAQTVPCQLRWHGCCPVSSAPGGHHKRRPFWQPGRRRSRDQPRSESRPGEHARPLEQHQSPLPSWACPGK